MNSNNEVHIEVAYKYFKWRGCMRFARLTVPALPGQLLSRPDQSDTKKKKKKQKDQMVKELGASKTSRM